MMSSRAAPREVRTEVFISGFRWRLPISEAQIDYETLQSWAEDDVSVIAFVRGAEVGGARRQEIGHSIVIQRSMGGPIPFIGLLLHLVSFVVFWTWTCRKLDKKSTRIQSPDPIGGAIGRVASLFSKPAIRVPHVQGPYFDPPREFGLRGRIWRRLQLFSVTGATVVRCGSSDSLRALNRLRPGVPATLVWSATDVDAFSHETIAAARPPERVLCASSLVGRKGIDKVIRGLAILDPTSRPELVVAGEGAERRALETLATALDVPVNFVGKVPHADLPTLMSSCSFFVLASSADASPRAVMEAMAAGAVVIVSQAGDLPEMVGTCGHVLTDTDPETIAAALDDLCGSREVRLALGECARQRALELFSYRSSISLQRQLGVLPASVRASPLNRRAISKRNRMSCCSS